MASTGQGGEVVGGDVAKLTAIEGLGQDCSAPEEGCEGCGEGELAKTSGGDERLGKLGLCMS